MASRSPVYGADGLVKIAVLAKPNARASTISEFGPDAVGVRLAARAQDGEANKELCDLIARTLRIPKRDVALDRGATSRAKVVICKGVTIADVVSALTKAADSSE